MVRPKAGSGHLGGPTGLVAFILLSTTLHLLAESPVQYGSRFQIEILVKNRSVVLAAPLNEDSHYLAEAFCYAHNLTSESSEAGQSCISAVEAELLRGYHRLEAASNNSAFISSSDGAAFSHIRRQALLPPRLRYRPEIDDPLEVAKRLEALYGEAPGLVSTILEAPHGLYVPVAMEGLREVEWEGRGTMTLPSRFDLPAQAQRLCAHFQVETTDGLLSTIGELLQANATPTARLVMPPAPLLSLDLDLEWSPGVPRRFVLYPGQELMDAVIAFCARHRCPDRLNQIDQIAAGIMSYQATARSSITLPLTPTVPSPSRSAERVVVSMSTLPSRLPYVADRITELKRQTRPPDHIYLCLPHWSLRERAPYLRSAVPQALVDDPDVSIVWSEIDWGPATKLIPVLDIERDPRTMVITADDDIIYPPHTLFELIVNSRRLPNAALGHLGFRLPRQRGVPLEHGHFHYREGCNETSDQVVDVLGGVTSVLYRVGFFDRSRLTDYIHYPSAAFYVDDEWIAAVLEEAGVPRVVLSRSSAPASACLLMEGANVLAYGREGHALNGPAHAHQNMEYQSMVLRYFREREGLWPVVEESGIRDKKSFLTEVFLPEYGPLLGRRAATFQFIFEWLEGLGKNSFTIVETGVISDPRCAKWALSGQATLLFDRFLNHYQGKLYSVDLDAHACCIARDVTSRSRSVVMHGDSVQALWSLSSTLAAASTRGEEEIASGGLDLVYLDSYDVDDDVTEGDMGADQASAEHHLKELAAILPHTRLLSTTGPGTLIVVDDNMQLPLPEDWPDDKPPPIKGKGRLVQELLHGRCREVFRDWQIGWLCGGHANGGH